MSWASQPLCVMLAVLLLFSGGIVDLCGCDGSAHGVFCAEAASSHVATASPGHACCAGPARPATGRRELPARTVSAAGCGCPTIALDRSPSEVVEVAHGVPSATDPGPSTDLPALASTSVPGERPGPGASVRGGAGPPGPSLRRHLLLHVLRL